MRLQELYHLVKTAIANWQDPKFEVNQSRQGANNYKLKNIRELSNLLTPLLPIEGVRCDVEDMFSIDEAFQKGGTSVFTEQEKQKITHLSSKIQQSLDTILGMCLTLGVEQNSCGFDVKLPPNITFSEFSECVKDLNNVFSRCPILQSKDEKIELLGVDVGSMWLTFSVVCFTSATVFYIVQNIGALVDTVITIREHKAVLKQQEELYRTTKIKNDMLEAIVKANNEVLNGIRQQASEALAHSRGIETEEDISELRGDMILLEKWVDRGMQIYASIDAPKETKSAFPPVERQSLPDMVKKALTGKSEEDSE